MLVERGTFCRLRVTRIDGMLLLVAADPVVIEERKLQQQRRDYISTSRCTKENIQRSPTFLVQIAVISNQVDFSEYTDAAKDIASIFWKQKRANVEHAHLYFGGVPCSENWKDT